MPEPRKKRTQPTSAAQSTAGNVISSVNSQPKNSSPANTSAQRQAIEQYSQRASQPTKWYSGEQPTTRETVARMYEVAGGDETKFAEMEQQFRQEQHTVGSPIFNPYTEATNYKALQGLGIDPVQGISHEDIQANMGMLNGMRTTTTGLNAAAPSRTSTPENNNAYWMQTIINAEDRTVAAETERAQLASDVAYWVNMGYSDAEAMRRVKANFSTNYPTLAKMDEERAQGSALALNRPVDYNGDDTICGMIYAARNPDAGSDYFVNSVLYTQGKGNQYVADPSSEAARDPSNLEGYDPYSLGSNMDSVNMHTGATSYDEAWLNANRSMLDDPDEAKIWRSVSDAVDNSDAATAELEKLNGEIDKWIESGMSYEDIISRVDGYLSPDSDDTSAYPTLAKMERLRQRGGYLELGYAVPFTLPSLRADVEQRVWKRDYDAAAPEREARMEAYREAQRMALSGETPPEAPIDEQHDAHGLPTSRDVLAFLGGGDSDAAEAIRSAFVSEPGEATSVDERANAYLESKYGVRLNGELTDDERRIIVQAANSANLTSGRDTVEAKAAAGEDAQRALELLASIAQDQGRVLDAEEARNADTAQTLLEGANARRQAEREAQEAFYGSAAFRSVFGAGTAEPREGMAEGNTDGVAYTGETGQIAAGAQSQNSPEAQAYIGMLKGEEWDAQAYNWALANSTNRGAVQLELIDGIKAIMRGEVSADDAGLAGSWWKRYRGMFPGYGEIGVDDGFIPSLANAEWNLPGLRSQIVANEGVDDPRANFGSGIYSALQSNDEARAAGVISQDEYISNALMLTNVCDIIGGQMRENEVYDAEAADAILADNPALMERVNAVTQSTQEASERQTANTLLARAQQERQNRGVVESILGGETLDPETSAAAQSILTADISTQARNDATYQDAMSYINENMTMRSYLDFGLEVAQGDESLGLDSENDAAVKAATAYADGTSMVAMSILDRDMRLAASIGMSLDEFYAAFPNEAKTPEQIQQMAEDQYKEAWGGFGTGVQALMQTTETIDQEMNGNEAESQVLDAFDMRRASIRINEYKQAAAEAGQTLPEYLQSNAEAAQDVQWLGNFDSPEAMYAWMDGKNFEVHDGFLGQFGIYQMDDLDTRINNQRGTLSAHESIGLGIESATAGMDASALKTIDMWFLEGSDPDQHMAQLRAQYNNDPSAYRAAMTEYAQSLPEGNSDIRDYILGSLDALDDPFLLNMTPDQAKVQSAIEGAESRASNAAALVQTYGSDIDRLTYQMTSGLVSSTTLMAATALGTELGLSDVLASVIAAIPEGGELSYDLYQETGNYNASMAAGLAYTVVNGWIESGTYERYASRIGERTGIGRTIDGWKERASKWIMNGWFGQLMANNPSKAADFAMRVIRSAGNTAWDASNEGAQELVQSIVSSVFANVVRNTNGVGYGNGYWLLTPEDWEEAKQEGVMGALSALPLGYGGKIAQDIQDNQVRAYMTQMGISTANDSNVGRAMDAAGMIQLAQDMAVSEIDGALMVAAVRSKVNQGVFTEAQEALDRIASSPAYTKVQEAQTALQTAQETERQAQQRYDEVSERRNALQERITQLNESIQSSEHVDESTAKQLNSAVNKMSGIEKQFKKARAALTNALAETQTAQRSFETASSAVQERYNRVMESTRERVRQSVIDLLFEGDSEAAKAAGVAFIEKAEAVAQAQEAVNEAKVNLDAQGPSNTRASAAYGQALNRLDAAQEEARQAHEAFEWARLSETEKLQRQVGQSLTVELEHPEQVGTEQLGTGHIDERGIDNVGKQYKDLFVEKAVGLRDAFSTAARVLLGDITESTRGGRTFTPVEGDTYDAAFNANRPIGWVIDGQKRHTSNLIAELLDARTFKSWNELTNAAQAFAEMDENNVPEPTLANRKMEAVLDGMMTNGYEGLHGETYVPWTSYIEVKAQYEGSQQHGVGESYTVPEEPVSFEDGYVEAYYGGQQQVAQAAETEAQKVAETNDAEAQQIETTKENPENAETENVNAENSETESAKQQETTEAQEPEATPKSASEQRVIDSNNRVADAARAAQEAFSGRDPVAKRQAIDDYRSAVKAAEEAQAAYQQETDEINGRKAAQVELADAIDEVASYNVSDIVNEESEDHVEAAKAYDRMLNAMAQLKSLESGLNAEAAMEALLKEKPSVQAVEQLQSAIEEMREAVQENPQTQENNEVEEWEDYPWPTDNAQSNSRISARQESSFGRQFIRENQAQDSESNVADIDSDLDNPIRIMRGLTRELGVRFNPGGQMSAGGQRLRTSVMAFYDNYTKTITTRSKYAGDLATNLHEYGHAVQQMLPNLHATEAMIGALPVMVKEDYSPAELDGEAVAEFVVDYMFSKPTAVQKYGADYVKAFEGMMTKNAKLTDVMQRAVDQVAAWNAANEESRLSAMVVDQDSAQQREKRSFGRLIREVQRGIFDYAVPAKQVSEDFYQKALYSAAGSKRADTILTREFYDLHGAPVDGALSLAARLAQAKVTKDMLQDVNTYALARHALNRLRAGKPVFSEAEFSKADLERIARKYETNSPEVVAGADAMVGFWQDVMDNWLLPSGIVSQQERDAFREQYPYYVPTFRAVQGSFDNTQGKIGTFKIRGAKVGGSSLEVLNPLNSIVMMTQQAVQSVNNNQMLQAFDKEMQTGAFGTLATQVVSDMTAIHPDTKEMQITLADMFEDLRGLLDPQKAEEMFNNASAVLKQMETQFRASNRSSLVNTVTGVREDGTRFFYQIHDKGLYKLLSGSPNTLSDFGKLVRNYKNAFTQLTTNKNPFFATKNAVRDFQASVNTGSWAVTYVDGAWKWAEAFKEVLTNSDDFKQWAAMGGGSHNRFTAENSKSAKQLVNMLLGARVQEDAEGNVTKITYKKDGKTLVFNAITMDGLNEAIENTSRFVEYKYGKHDLSTFEGRQAAFMASQEVTTNFAKRGAWGIMNSITAAVPFCNATLQGLAKDVGIVATAFNINATEQQRQRAWTAIGKTTLNVGLSAALQAVLLGMFGAGDDDDRAQEYAFATDEMKAGYFSIRLPDSWADALNIGDRPWVRIPIEQGPLARTIYAAGLEMFSHAGNMSAMDLDMLETAKSIIRDCIPDGSIAQTILDARANRTWYGGQIVSDYALERSAPYQYNNDTLPVFKNVANWLNQNLHIEISPAVAQYVTGQYLGVLGNVASPLLSPDELTGEWSAQGAMRNLLRSALSNYTYDPLTSTYVTEDYSSAKALLTSVNKDFAAGERPAELSTNLDDYQVGEAVDEATAMLGKNGIFGRADREIRALWQDYNDIKASPTLSEAEKRRQMREIRREIVLVEQEALMDYKDFETEYISGDTVMRTVMGKILE